MQTGEIVLFELAQGLSLVNERLLCYVLIGGRRYRVVKEMAELLKAA